jgi:chemosensory pili system protein ChpA (sensor histidine kinase/response regulator)
MRLHENIDFTTLTWVKPELDETLRQARNALQNYVEEGESPAELRTCADLLHQVQGTLRMVELYGAAMVAEEMEQLAKALVGAKVDNRDNAYAVLMQGIVQLPDYLERLQSGHRDIPIVLLPLLNQLRESRGEKGLSESVLFSPDLSRPLPASAQGPATPLDQGELSRRAETLRGLYQGSLLRWLKDDNSPATIRDLTDVCEQLVPITSAEPARRLFWVAAGTLDALGRNAFPTSNPLKQALARVEREIKRLADGGDAAFRSDPPIELTKQLLYFVAHEGSDTGRIGEIRQVFGLSGNEPSDAELAHARGSLAGNNRALLETVGVAIKEDLLRVKDALDLHLRTPGASPAGLSAQADALDRVADTLGMLGLGVPRRVVQDQRSAINDVVTGQRKDDENTLLDIAGALLYVEAALDDQVERLGKDDGQPAESGDSSNESRRLLEVLVKEAIVNFSQARQSFVAFVETHWDHAQLAEVPRLLTEVSGALRILNIPEPADYLIGVRQFTDNELLRRRQVPNGQQMDRLADALASLEYFLEALRDRRPNREQILEVARQSLVSLGYWPLTAELRATSPMAAAVAAAPEPARAPAAEPIQAAPVAPAAPVSPAAEAVAAAPAAATEVPAAAPATAAPAPIAAAPALAPVGLLVSGFDAASSEEIDDEIREVFLEEFEEEIDNLAQLLPAWRADPDNPELLRPIRRVFHTLKGSGRLVGAKSLGEFSWKVESMLNRVLDGSRPASPQVLALVQLALEQLPVLRAALQGQPVHADLDGIQAVAEQLAAGEEVSYAATSTIAVGEAAEAAEAVASAAVEPTVAVEPEAEAVEAGQAGAGPVFSIDPVLLEILKPEVAGHLEVVDAWLAACAARGPQPVSDPLLRSIHTMNGAFAMTDVMAITDVTAPLEGFVKRALAHQVTPGAEAVAVVADAAEAIRTTIRAIEKPRPVLPHFHDLSLRAHALRDSLPDSLLPSVPVHAEDDTAVMPQVVIMEAPDVSAIPDFGASAESAAAAEAAAAAALAAEQEAAQAAEREAALLAEREAAEAAEREAAVLAEREAAEAAEREAAVLAEREAAEAAEREAALLAEREAAEAAEREAAEAADREATLLAEREAAEAAEREAALLAEREAAEAAEREAALLAEREAAEAAEREAAVLAEREAAFVAEREAELAAEREAELSAQREAAFAAELAAEREAALAAEHAAALAAEPEAALVAEQEIAFAAGSADQDAWLEPEESVAHAEIPEGELLSLESFLREGSEQAEQFRLEEAEAELAFAEQPAIPVQPAEPNPAPPATVSYGFEDAAASNDFAEPESVPAFVELLPASEVVDFSAESALDRSAEPAETVDSEAALLADTAMDSFESFQSFEAAADDGSSLPSYSSDADDEFVAPGDEQLLDSDWQFPAEPALVIEEASPALPAAPAAELDFTDVPELTADFAFAVDAEPEVEQRPRLVAVSDDFYGMSMAELEALTAPQALEGRQEADQAELAQAGTASAPFDAVPEPMAHADAEAGGFVPLAEALDALGPDEDFGASLAAEPEPEPVAVEADGFAHLPQIGEVPAWVGEGEDYPAVAEEPMAAEADPSVAASEPAVPEPALPAPETFALEVAAEELVVVDELPVEAELAAEATAEAETAGRADAEQAEAEQAEQAEQAEAEQAEAEQAEAEQAAQADEPEAELLFEDDAAEDEVETPAAASAEADVEPVHSVRPTVPLALDAADPEEALDTSDLDTELLDLFLEESNDILDHCDGMLARLRDQVEDRESIISLQRDLHTLKGGARMAGIYAVGELGHAMESLLEAAAEGRRRLDASGVVVLERGFDRLHGMVARIGDRKAIALPAMLIAQVEALSEGRSLDSLGTGAAVPAAAAPAPMRRAATPTTAPAEAGSEAGTLGALSAPLDELGAEDEITGVRAPQEQVRIRADLLDRLVNYAGEVAIYRARLEQQLGAFRANLGELDQTTTRLREQLRRLDIETEAQIIARYQREGEANDERFDPLELDRFTNQQQLTRGLNESANDLVNLQGVLDELTRQYETLLLQQSRVSSDLQEGLMRTRMVPFDALVPRLRRVLRQAAIDTGKQVQLKVDGASGEMDRNVLDRMTAPLEHMLRNAMAHGLELPEDRRKAKKPEEGMVRIAVHREGSEVVIKVSDDGRGLDKVAIRNKAIERGLIKADAELSDQALYSLVLEAGFSTAETVSRLSGRGVGMDVVYSEIRQLGGTLTINSNEGKGSEFVIRLPFTLAVTQAVFVKIGDTSFAVPIASVQGVGRIARADLDKQLATENPVFKYAGEDYAIHDLGTLIGHAPAKAQDSLQMPLLLARSGDLRTAISIDQVLGSREIVVKPVGPQVNSVPGIFGATIMGDGRVVVILDVAPLVRRHSTIVRDAVPAAPVAVVAAHRIPVVMVVDDSITMRKVTGRVLERNNMEVLTAKDGVDAVEKMAERVPDLVLLDIEMPRMDGYEVAQNMKSDPRLKDVPIIMITSRTGDKHRQRAMDIGVDRYLGKPYQEPELMRNVFEMLGMETVNG